MFIIIIIIDHIQFIARDIISFLIILLFYNIILLFHKMKPEQRGK